MNLNNRDARRASEDEEKFFPAEEEQELFAEGAEKNVGGEEKNAQKEQALAAAGKMLQDSQKISGGSGFHREINELLKARPELREKITRGDELPREVLFACAKEGVPLRAAYAEYELQQAKGEIRQLRREIRILRQNADAAAKAPVRGAAGSSTDTKGKDPFLEGLLSDN